MSRVEDRIIRINKMNGITRHPAHGSFQTASVPSSTPRLEPTKSCNPENPVNPVCNFERDEFPLAPGIPMHLLTERSLNEAFLDVVEKHRRDGLPVVVRREGELARLPVEQLSPEITRARNRIAELTAAIAKYERSPFSVNETPERERQDYQD
jgi:hypothetical protein